MKLEKKTAEYKIYKRKDGRFAVENKKGKAVNGDEKVEILMAEGLVTKPEPKAEPEPEAVEEAAEEAAAAEEEKAAE